jgi:hypothetical protein
MFVALCCILAEISAAGFYFEQRTLSPHIFYLFFCLRHIACFCYQNALYRSFPLRATAAHCCH